MYQSSSALIEPIDSNQFLWRYMTHERLVDFLKTGELYFAHVPQFEDGFEGRLTARTRAHLHNWFVKQGSSASIADEEVKQYESHSNAFHANCWHMNESESYLMWKAYAGRGYAIRTTLERLKNSLAGFSGAVTGSVMHYVNFEDTLTSLGNVFNHVTTKDLPYKDEREFRLLFWHHDPSNQEINSNQRGLRIPIDKNVLIESIFVNPNILAVDEITTLVNDLNLSCNNSRIKIRGLQ
jgi:hypothetical protein